MAWRIGLNESSTLVRLAFADLLKNHGVPQAVLLDNGRAFASKWLTGGAKNRFRFKIKAEEPLWFAHRPRVQNSLCNALPRPGKID